MSTFHDDVTAPSRRGRALREMADLLLKTCTALLITFVAAAAVILLRAELYLSGFSRISNGG